MKNGIKTMKVEKLALWDQNPRNDREWIFKTDEKSERDIIVEMLMDPKIKNSMTGLIDDLLTSGEFRESIIVYEHFDKNGELVHQTYDGNRRMTALRLIKYPDIIKENGFDIEKIKKINDLIKEVKCNFYSSEFRNAALEHVKNRHSGSQLGKGRLDWNANNKENISLLLGSGSLSIGSKIIDFFQNNENIKSDQKEFRNKVIENADKSTLDRIFGSKVIKDKLRIQKGDDYDLDNQAHIDKISEILEVFLTQTSGKVRDVYYKSDIEGVFANVQPINNKPIPPTLFNPKTNKRKNNKYKQQEYLFAWRAQGINIEDKTFKSIFKTTIERYGTKSVDYLPNFEIITAPLLYRILLELSIKKFIEYFKDNKKVFNLNVTNDDHLFKALNTSVNTPVVNSKKISSILIISKRIKNNNKLNEIQNPLNYFSEQGFFTESNQKLNTFTDQINDTAHGNIVLSTKHLRMFDKHIMNFIKLVSTLTN